MRTRFGRWLHTHFAWNWVDSKRCVRPPWEWGFFRSALFPIVVVIALAFVAQKLIAG